MHGNKFQFSTGGELKVGIIIKNIGSEKYDNYPSYGGKISTSKVTLDEIGGGAGNGLDKHSRLPSMKSVGKRK